MSDTKSKYGSIAELVKAIDRESGTFETTVIEFREILRGSLHLVFGNKVSALASVLGYDKKNVETFLNDNGSRPLLNDAAHRNRKMLAIRREIPKDQLPSMHA